MILDEISYNRACQIFYPGTIDAFKLHNYWIFLHVLKLITVSFRGISLKITITKYRAGGAKANYKELQR